MTQNYELLVNEVDYEKAIEIQKEEVDLNDSDNNL